MNILCKIIFCLTTLISIAHAETTKMTISYDTSHMIQVDDNAAYFVGRMNINNVGILIDVIQLTGLKTLVIKSIGGVAISGFMLGEFIHENDINIIINEYCISACAFALMGANEISSSGENYEILIHHPSRTTFDPHESLIEIDKKGQMFALLLIDYFIYVGYSIELINLTYEFTDSYTYMVFKDIEKFKKFHTGDFTTVVEIGDNWFGIEER